MPDACSISMRGMRNGLNADLFHGSANAVTSFRNYFAGWEPGKTGGTFGFSIYALNRYFNMVGNVLGTSSYHSIYEIYPPSFGPPTSIYQLGGGNSEGSIRIPADSLVRKTLMRWGNFDTVNNSVQWNSSEIPSGLIQYANAVPASQNLPASFFLPAKPNFWGTMPWPAIGPDVKGGTGPGGYAYAIPAQHCYTNSPIDSNYGSNNVLLFNANACYSQSAPTAPKNLTAIVQ